MSPSKLSPLFITLSLILFSQVQGSLYEDLCKNLEGDSARCLRVLKAEPRIASAKTELELCKVVLQFAIKKGTEGQNYLKELAKTNPSEAISRCANMHYNGVVGSFKSALGELKVDGLTANYDAKVAGDGPMTCDRALADAKINNPATTTAITALNKEILLISTIAFYATNNLPSGPAE